MAKINEKLPYSIRCLKAIQEIVGSRQRLAKICGVTEHSISHWVNIMKIPRSAILTLITASKNKFSAEELLGAYDNEKSGNGTKIAR